MAAKMKIHPLALVWPPIPTDRFKELVEDIHVLGLLEPITLYEGKVLDGRNRYLACLAAGEEPRFETFEGTHDDAVAFVVAKNRVRRHLSEGQQDAALLEAMARLRTRDRIRDWRADKVKQAAKRTNLARLADVQATDPDIFTQVALGQLTLTGAENIIRRNAVNNTVVPLPDDVFNVIYADPPWRLNDEQPTPRNITTRDAETHYATMALAEIKAMPVPAAAADNCVLFLWATASLLPQAMEVIPAWGFRYVNSFVWDKERIGIGRWVRGQHELLLIGVKGRPGLPLPANLASSVIREKRREHSRKPDRAYEIVETYYPKAKRLELFARTARKGWTAWGAEAPKPNA